MAKAPATTRKSASSSKTRARATTSRKTSTSLKEIAEAAEPTPSVVAEGPTEDGGLDLMRKKELIEAAVLRAGVKKRDAKPAIEAALSIIGETLTSGRGLNMPGLGKVKVQNSKELEDVQVVNLRLRRKTGEAEETVKEGLAEPAE
ncbi:HU family DNA-binding protein [Shimia sagamensis]|uniref:DNA-binding protein n=1 Tax=Shimia sagamensis TaxID=1566352 RepID=A0ABY1NZC1_9RHOB|nr:HU family DNA-binding protein [Shimia sagamensis]SMP22621.1 DNA-binding protein [Shimia sagamensis]